MASMEIPVNKKQVKLAVSALLAHIEERAKQPKKKDELFKKEDALWLMVSFKKIPIVKNKPKKILLPHSIHDEEDVCLISKDPPKKIKEVLQKENIKSIKKVISLTKLRKEYKTYFLKRQLASSFDVFLCDDRVYHLAVSTLGKEFFKRKKEPIPVRLTYKNWGNEISKCLRSTLLRMGHGPCSAVKVGLVEKHSEKELIENVLHAMKVVALKVPGSWKNIQVFHVKTSSTVALPVYQSSPTVLPSAFQISEKAKAKQKRKRKLSENKKTDESKENSNPIKEVVDSDENSKGDAFSEPKIKKKVKKVQKKVKNKNGKKVR